eukprot:gene1035-2025_t
MLPSCGLIGMLKKEKSKVINVDEISTDGNSNSINIINSFGSRDTERFSQENLTINSHAHGAHRTDRLEVSINKSTGTFPFLSPSDRHLSRRGDSLDYPAAVASSAPHGPRGSMLSTLQRMPSRLDAGFQAFTRRMSSAVSEKNLSRNSSPSPDGHFFLPELVSMTAPIARQNLLRKQNSELFRTVRRRSSDLSRLYKLGVLIFPIASAENHTENAWMNFRPCRLRLLDGDTLISILSFCNKIDIINAAATGQHLHKIIFNPCSFPMWNTSPLEICMMAKEHQCFCLARLDRRFIRTHMPNDRYSLSLISSCGFERVDIHCPLQEFSHIIVAMASYGSVTTLDLKIDFERRGKIAFNPQETLKSLSSLEQNVGAQSFLHLRSLHIVDSGEVGMFEVGLAGWTRVFRILGNRLEDLQLETAPVPGLFKILYNHCPMIIRLKVTFFFVFSDFPEPEVISYYSPILQEFDLNLFDPKFQRFGRLLVPALKRLSIYFGGSSWHWDEDYIQETVFTIPVHIESVRLRAPGVFANQLVCVTSTRFQHLKDIDLSFYDLGEMKIQMNTMKMMLADSRYIGDIRFPEEVEFDEGAIAILGKFPCLHSLTIRGKLKVIEDIETVLMATYSIKNLILVVPRYLSTSFSQSVSVSPNNTSSLKDKLVKEKVKEKETETPLALAIRNLCDRFKHISIAFEYL